jgi:AraC-like DNA-binding protein
MHDRTEPQAPATTRVWSTDSVPPRDRETYWIEAISEAFLAMQSRPRERRDFHGRVTRHELGALALVRVDSQAQDVARLESHLTSDASPAFYLITQLDHPWAVAQRDRYIELAPGDLVLVDAAQPYRFHCPSEVHNLSLELPRPWLQRWLADPGAHLTRRIHGDAGQGTALRGLLQWLAADPAHSSIEIEQAIGKVLQCCSGDDAATERGDDRWRRLDRMLRQRLTETGLQVADLAADLGCSVATVHRLFAAQGTGFAERLTELRLAQAERMLREPHLRCLSVAQIGLRCGFRDPSHFGRTFARHTGTSPGAWREGQRHSAAQASVLPLPKPFGP